MLKPSDIKEFKEALSSIRDLSENVFLVEFLSSVKEHNTDELLIKMLVRLCANLKEASSQMDDVYKYLEQKNSES